MKKQNFYVDVEMIEKIVDGDIVDFKSYITEVDFADADQNIVSREIRDTHENPYTNCLVNTLNSTCFVEFTLPETTELKASDIKWENFQFIHSPTNTIGEQEYWMDEYSLVTIAGDYLLVGFISTATTNMVNTQYYAAGVFNTALTSKQVRDMAEYGILPSLQWGDSFGGSTPGCIGWWDFANGSSASVFDASNSARTGTLTGTVVRRPNDAMNNYYRTNAGSPSGVLTPRYIGEEVLNTSGNQWFKAYGLTDASWAALN